MASAPQPAEERLRDLRRYFEPEIGQLLYIAPNEERSRQRVKAPHLLRGYIKVSPPPGACFIITRDRNRPDERVCQPATLAFTLQELAVDGRLNWQLSTGPQDFGTDISWPTPYRVGRIVTNQQAWPGPSQPVYLKECKAATHSQLGRRVYIKLFHGETWSLALPQRDTLIEQPKWEQPNLYVLEKSGGGGGIPKKEDKKEQAPPAEAPASDEAKAAPPKEEAKAAAEAAAKGEAEPAPPKKPHASESSRSALVSPWQLHPRHTYTVNAANFTTGAAHPPGMRGECRYKYTPNEDGSEAGWLECMDADRFKWLLLPLPCLSELAPAEAKAVHQKPTPP